MVWVRVRNVPKNLEMHLSSCTQAVIIAWFTAPLLTAQKVLTCIMHSLNYLPFVLNLLNTRPSPNMSADRCSSVRLNRPCPFASE